MEVNQLAALGLSQSQIKRVLERIPKESVHLFIKQWMDEKRKTSKVTEDSDIRRTNQFESRRRNYNPEPKYSRDQDFIHNTTVKTPYMPRILKTQILIIDFFLLLIKTVRQFHMKNFMIFVPLVKNIILYHS